MDISNNALLSLYGNLRSFSRIWQSIADESDTTNAAHYKERQRFMSKLADSVLDEIEKRAIA